MWKPVRPPAVARPTRHVPVSLLLCRPPVKDRRGAGALTAAWAPRSLLGWGRAPAEGATRDQASQSGVGRGLA